MKKFLNKNYEYEVKDSNAEVSDAKKFYNEIENQYIGLKNKFNHFKNCVEQEMKNRNLLIPLIREFYNTCFIVNPNYGKKPLLEDAFNLITFNLWSDNFDQEKKYILDGSKNLDEHLDKLLKLSKKDVLLKNESKKAYYEFINLFNRGGYGKFYNRADYNYEKEIPQFSNYIINFIKQNYFSPFNESNDLDRNLIMFSEDAKSYDLSSIGLYNILEGYQLDLTHFINELNNIDIQETENEFKQFLKGQKEIFYQSVIIPLLKWKKSSSEKLMQELRIKKHETTKGYIYILTNKSFPDFIKIGSTMRDPRIRANELTGTGVPFPYEVEYKIATKNCEILEKKVHTILEKKRVDIEREFFKCSVDEAKKIINEVVEKS